MVLEYDKLKIKEYLLWTYSGSWNPRFSADKLYRNYAKEVSEPVTRSTFKDALRELGFKWKRGKVTFELTSDKAPTEMLTDEKTLRDE